MRHHRTIVWILFACIVATGGHAGAQSLSEVSAGATAVTGIGEGDFIGWYMDARRWIRPGLGIVGEASGYYNRFGNSYGNRGWHAVLGGLRVDTRPREKPAIFGQVLVGLAIARSGAGTFAVQPGLGLRVPLDDRWSLQVRADLRFGVVGDLPVGGAMIGAGVSRSFE